MFLEKKLPEGASTTAPGPKPKKRIELRVFVDRERAELRIEPRGILEADCQAEIVRELGFLVGPEVPRRTALPMKGPASVLVIKACEVAGRWGWELVDFDVDETKTFVGRIAKEVDE